MVDRKARGISVVEILIVLLVAGVGCGALYSYMGATKKSLDTLNTARPLGYTRLAADLATLAAIRNQLDLHYSTHGQRPPSREAAGAVLKPAPRFQCAGNDFTYDPTSGAIALVIMDPAGCN
jgi:Tfp pilus assembly protein PilV